MSKYKDVIPLIHSPMWVSNPLSSQIIIPSDGGFDPVAFMTSSEGDQNPSWFVGLDSWYNKLDLPNNFKPHELKELKRFMKNNYL